MESEVQVHLFAAAAAAVGERVVGVPAGSLGEILDGLQQRYPAFADVRPRCSFLVEGLNSPADTVVGPGGRVDVLPPFAGG